MSEYRKLHGNRLNLLVHLLMVPQFIIACAGLLLSIALRHLELGILWASVALLSIIGQTVAHLFERHPQQPYRGPADFVERWFVEQFYTFPRFVMKGEWWRAFKES